MNKFIIASSISALLLVSACAEEKKRANDSDKAQVEKETLTEEKKGEKEMKAPISSPEKMFDFIHKNGVEYSRDLMNVSSNVQSYVAPQEKALNLGIYTTDLAYAATYQDIESSVDLYKVVKRLGSELDIAEMMTAAMVEEMQANMEDPDSLAVVAGHAYYQAVEFLENNGQNGKLALMSVGGWIESLYISMMAMDEIEENSNSSKQIAGQKSNFKDLYNYLQVNSDKLGVNETISDLSDIHSILEGFSEDTNEGGINQEQYAQLKKAIIDYRDKIVEVTTKG